MKTSKKRFLSIWSFVGFILIIYGVLISAAGIYYLFNPPTHVALAHLNPSLWWGGFLLIVGLIFNWFDLRRFKKPG